MQKSLQCFPLNNQTDCSAFFIVQQLRVCRQLQSEQDSLRNKDKLYTSEELAYYKKYNAFYASFFKLNYLTIKIDLQNWPIPLYGQSILQPANPAQQELHFFPGSKSIQELCKLVLK